MPLFASVSLNMPYNKWQSLETTYILFELVYDRNHLFGFGSDTETETDNWPKLAADTETNRNCKIYIKHYIKRSAKKVCVMSITKTFIGYTTNK